MKTLGLLSLFVLAVALSSCSSGSSSEPGTTTSTNTVPNTNNTTDTGNSTDPSEDQPTTAGGTSTTGDTGSSDVTSGDNTDSATGADTAGDSAANSGTDVATETTGGTDTAGGTSNGSTGSGDADGGGMNGPNGNDTGGEATGGTETTDAAPKIDPNSALGKMQSRVKKLTGRILISLNQSLSQGEMLTPQQEQCLGTYDPAIGEPLLSIDCDNALATGDVLIFASIASFHDTPGCRADLQDNRADACTINQAEFQANPLFNKPEPQRPPLLKFAGAMLSYNLVENRLIIENLPDALDGRFRCEYDLTNGNAFGGDPGSNCYDRLISVADLINEHLAVEND